MLNQKNIARGKPFSGADLANLVNEAALFAARSNRRFEWIWSSLKPSKG